LNKYIFTLITFFGVLDLGAQEVISTQGDTYSNSIVNMAFTIGEVVVNTANNGDNTLTQGFHQTNWHFVSVVNHAPKFEVSIFPNPSSDVINIKTNNYEKVSYTLFNAQGKQVMQAKLANSRTTIEVKHFAPGNYTLVIQEANNLLNKTFKLLKIK